MKPTKLIATVLISVCIGGCSSQKEPQPEAAIENKVDSLLSQMTLEEKLGQMNQLSPWDFEELAARIRKGEVGSILNVVNPEEINKIQKLQ